MNVEQITPVCANHGEGPVWDASVGEVRWVDMLAGDVLTLGSGGEVRRHHVGDVAGAMRPRRGGGLVVSVERGFVLVDADGEVGPVHSAFDDPGVRMNEGGCPPDGRFFFCGSMAYDFGAGRGALYRFGTDRSVAQVLDRITISNGMAWTPDGSLLYYIDSPTHRVDVFDYDARSGTMHDRRPVVSVDPDRGMPDGMALDAEGGLWVALWGGGAVHRYSSRGTLDAVVQVPAAQVTACAFGGPDLDELYITTSRDGLGQDAEPAAGALFRVDPGVRGAPVGTFAG